MKSAHVELLDLNLLLLFHHLWMERNVSRAAERLGLSQSAASHALARLRRLFDDALFVRAGGMMLPTPRANELADPVQAVIQRVERDILPRTRFDVASAQRQFTIALSDLGEVVMLPFLLQEFARLAPGCTLVSARVPNAAIEDALERGTLDLAIGNVFEPRRNAFQQTLYTHHYRVIAWDHHPRLGKRLTLAQYQQERHLAADTGSDEHLRVQGLIPRGVKRQVAATAGGLLALPWVLPETELLATVPGHLARVACGRFPLQSWPLPFEVPDYAIKTYWHARMHGDEGHRWFRETVYELMRHYPDWAWDSGEPSAPLRPRVTARGKDQPGSAAERVRGSRG